MNAKELGSTGVLLPEVGIGTWNHRGGLGPLRRGLEAGALFLDTGETYGTETLVGEAVKGMRDRVFIATKVSEVHFRRQDFRKSVDASLGRLGVDHIDLLQLHHPNAHVPIAETMEAMSEAIDAGKVRFAGVSNFSIAQLEEGQSALGRHPIVSNQVRYNLIDRTIESGLLQYCQSHAVTVIAYSPLARGLGRIADCDPGGAIREVARMTGRTSAQVVLNWCLCKERVVVIPAGNTEEHVLENCGASDWRLTPEQLMFLDSRVQSRHRTRFDALVRQYIPPSFVQTVVRIRDCLPRSLRRRLT